MSMLQELLDVSSLSSASLVFLMMSRASQQIRAITSWCLVSLRYGCSNRVVAVGLFVGSVSRQESKKSLRTGLVTFSS